ncbi:hypothetical protein [Solimonas variicoloris]|uniref:hypothetical protein n=1 Tax=Solimonas variicoloris TaxID=254408 RepID=UPI0012B5C497|nr:hypothetical protein [Solimonas variicoloris]
MSLPDNWNSEDPEHPIPSPGRIDVFVTTKEGSTYYGLVVAAPLRADMRSQRRLLQKLEDYMSDRHSEKLLLRFGDPTPMNTKLIAAIHPGSEPGIFALLERCRPWLEQNGFALKVTTVPEVFGLH